MTCEFVQTGPSEWHCTIHDRTVVQVAEPNFCYHPDEPRPLLAVVPPCPHCGDGACDGECDAAVLDMDARAAYWLREVA